MESLPLPKVVQVVNKGNHYDSIIIEPCWPGYGTTLANALRRVLLSSLPGAAVTMVKINNVSHEFSTLPGVKEDVVDIMLNLKLLRLKVFSDEPVKIQLKASGEKIVTAKDIKSTSDVEVINKDLLIATLTEKKAELDIELTVANGRGYSPVESREKEKIELGQIAIDSIFGPVIKVGFNVEDVRVGQVTNFDKITLEVETDGTISPLEAVKEASKILVDHFNFIVNQSAGETKEETPVVEAVAEEEGKKVAKKRGRPKKEV
ncbi:MAG: DNA-directed RNA polymerase subunit alpha [Patescibacteria group bacterium]